MPWYKGEKGSEKSLFVLEVSRLPSNIEGTRSDLYLSDSSSPPASVILPY